jgi:hypothetical protein
VDLTFTDCLDRLRLAQELVRDETEQLAQATSGDHRPTLWWLRKIAQDHQNQANALLIAMLDRSAPEDMLEEAEEIAGFFNDAVGRIETLLVVGRRQGRGPDDGDGSPRRQMMRTLREARSAVQAKM